MRKDEERAQVIKKRMGQSIPGQLKNDMTFAPDFDTFSRPRAGRR